MASTSPASPRHGRRGGRRKAATFPVVAFASMVVGLIVMSVALWPLLLGDDDSPDPGAALPASPAPSVSVPSASVRSGSTLTPLDLEPGSPRRLVIKSLGVSAPVVPIEMADATLTPPDDPMVLGWWSAGAEPGADHGAALVTGHTVHTGGGALDNLEDLSPGDRLWMKTEAGRTPYVVRDVAIYRKKSLAREAATLFAQDGPGRLVVVTCEDWDGTAYLSNVVVVAEPSGDTR